MKQPMIVHFDLNDEARKAVEDVLNEAAFVERTETVFSGACEGPAGMSNQTMLPEACNGLVASILAAIKANSGEGKAWIVYPAGQGFVERQVFPPK